MAARDAAGVGGGGGSAPRISFVELPKKWLEMQPAPLAQSKKKKSASKKSEGGGGGGGGGGDTGGAGGVVAAGDDGRGWVEAAAGAAPVGVGSGGGGDGADEAPVFNRPGGRYPESAMGLVPDVRAWVAARGITAAPEVGPCGCRPLQSRHAF